MATPENRVPRHVAIVVDGNRRWAKGHGIPTYEGHMAGYNTLLEIAPEFLERGVEYLTLYAFSTENWNRSKSEVERLMSLIIKALTDDFGFLDKHQVRLRVLGSRENVSEKIVKLIESTEERTKDYKGGTLGVCFNYGGKQEIADAVKKIVQEGVSADEITPELIAQNLYVDDIPDVDVVVRTGGEKRLSNFMLWRAAYSEFIFLDKMWPDMTKDDVEFIISEYANRNRRFGA